MSDKNWGNYQYKFQDPITLPEVPKHRSKKNTRNYCKGKEGHPHTPEVVNKVLYGRERKCGPNAWGLNPYNWTCWHWERCTGCEKYLRKILSFACPDRIPSGI